MHSMVNFLAELKSIESRVKSIRDNKKDNNARILRLLDYLTYLIDLYEKEVEAFEQYMFKGHGKIFIQ